MRQMPRPGISSPSGRRSVPPPPPRAATTSRVITVVIFRRQHVRQLRLIHGVQQSANLFRRHLDTCQRAELEHQTNKHRPQS